MWQGSWRNGDEVKVTDHVSGADLTSATLAQIIFEEEKHSARLGPRVFAASSSMA